MGGTCRLRWYGRIETGSRIPIWRTFGRIQWHVIPERRATLQGAAAWRIQCHDPEPHWKSFFAVFYFLFSLCILGFGVRRLSYRLRYTCYYYYKLSCHLSLATMAPRGAFVSSSPLEPCGALGQILAYLAYSIIWSCLLKIAVLHSVIIIMQ